MNEENLNMEIRKFLKKVGISSQRILENYITSAFDEGSIKANEEIEVEMKMIIKGHDVEHLISEKLKIE